MTQAGVATYQRGDYETALREFRLLAQQGNASAQFNLGRMYEKVEYAVPYQDIHSPSESLVSVPGRTYSGTDSH